MSDTRSNPFSALPIEPEVKLQLEARGRRRHKRTTKQRAHDAQRSKMTYDLADGLIQAVLNVSEELDCSQSDVAAHFLAAGLQQYRENRLDLKAIRRPHRCSLRFDFKLDPPSVNQQ